MRVHCARTALTAVFAMTLFVNPGADATRDRRADGVRRHHGLGEAGYRHADGVRRFHGLGDGFCAGPYPVYGWYTPVTLPYRVVVVDGTPLRRRPPIRPSLIGPGHAWSMLGRGDAQGALTEFAVLALRRPDDAHARAGYALAAAALGRHETAAWAMRRAFVTDATAVRDLALDADVRGLVLQLREAYARRAAPAPEAEIDGMFMIAALSFLLEDDDLAREAIATVRHHDRTDRATLILVRMLRLTGRPEPLHSGV